MMDFTVHTDLPAIKSQISVDINWALPLLSEQILQDCNYFCKQDQGGLIASSLSASDLEHGNLIWDTVYAVMQYYLGATNQDVNANATKMWCDKAFAIYGRDWETFLQNLLIKGR